MTTAKRIALAHRMAVLAHARDMLDLEKATATRQQREAEGGRPRDARRLIEALEALTYRLAAEHVGDEVAQPRDSRRRPRRRR